PRQLTDYRAFIDSVLSEYRRDPRYADLRFTLDAPTSLPPVHVVPSAWSKLLRNLIDNAVVQPATRKEIVVAARVEAGQVITEVRDFGPGISPGNRDKIFRRFFTQRPEGAPPGTGLGLSIVQTVAERHGGDVDVTSSPGEGATFRVTLPV
ncbi:MAG TPA: HAMP domain-containing sensor histidine kinase, partial [Myxococcaceae bacterium]|nr:HAMP domain-containing sensor histidine kinase [Myxococcaceae bacterium]